MSHYRHDRAMYPSSLLTGSIDNNNLNWRRLMMPVPGRYASAMCGPCLYYESTGGVIKRLKSSWFYHGYIIIGKFCPCLFSVCRYNRTIEYWNCLLLHARDWIYFLSETASLSICVDADFLTAVTLFNCLIKFKNWPWIVWRHCYNIFKLHLECLTE